MKRSRSPSPAGASTSAASDAAGTADAAGAAYAAGGAPLAHRGGAASPAARSSASLDPGETEAAAQPGAPLVLNAEQLAGLAAVEAGHNVYIAGGAGVGKSVLAQRVVSLLRARYGAANGMDRDDVAKEDWKKIKQAIGANGRANFSSTHDCTPLGGERVRELGTKVDFSVIRVRYRYLRSTT